MGAGASRHAALALVIAAAAISGFGTYRWWLQRQAGLQPLLATPATVSTPASPLVDAADAGNPVPETVPDIRLEDLGGKTRGLREFTGRPLLINFWATWCAPCRREIPLLHQLRTRHAAERLEVVGIAVDFRDAIARYVQKTPIAYPLLIGEQGGLEAARQFGMDLVLPFSVFADAGGHIVAVKVGELHDEDAEAILAAMGDLAAGRLDLAATRSRIDAKLKELAARRARNQPG